MGIGINIPIEEGLPPIGAPYHNDDPCPIIEPNPPLDKETKILLGMLFSYKGIVGVIKALGGKG